MTERPSPSVAVITGASSGIGRAIAHELATGGMSLVLAARDPATLDEAAAECRELGAPSVLAVPTDVSDSKAVQNLMDRAVEQMDRVDVWVNNAAVMTYGRLEDVPHDVYRHVIEVNLFGAIEGSRVALHHFRQTGGGHLINISSLYAKMTSPLVGSYVVSKFGLLGFTEVLRQEAIEERGINVSLVLPGSMDSPIFRHAANFTGRSVRPVPPVSDVRRVARAVSRLVERPRKQVVVGNTHRLLSWGRAAFPRLYDNLTPAVMAAAGLESRPAPHDSGNVFQPRPEWNRMYGSWSRVQDLAAVGRGAVAAGSRMARMVQRAIGRE